MSEQGTMENSNIRRFRPATDIVELSDGFHIFMDMPGLSKENLQIDLKENEISVSGTTTPIDEKEENVTHREFVGGEYERSFTISDNVDRERIVAKLTNGVLELHLPKSEKAMPRKIEIVNG